MVALLVAALGLAGCGGGGGGTAAEEPAPTPTPQEMCEADGGRYNADGTCTSAADLAAEQLAATKKRASDAATAARAAAMAAAGLDHADDDATAAAIAAANEAAAAAEAASNAAQDASSQDAASALADVAESQQADAEAALANARTASGMAAQAAADAAATAAVTKSATSKRAAIAAEATSAAAPFDDATTITNNYGIGISRDRDGTEIEITVPGAGDDDPEFMHAMDLGGGKNAFSMHTRTMEADDDGNVEEEVVIIGTDIEAPKATAFAKVAGQALNVDLELSEDADNDGTANNDLTALSVGGTSDNDLTTVPTGDTLKLVRSSAFAAGSGSSTVHTFARFQLDSDAGTDGNQTIKAFETAGTYNGAMGTYRCASASADCTVTVSDKGAITAMSAGWAFTPAEGATSDVSDADFKHFGVWIMKTTDSEGAVTYNAVQTFTGSSVPATASSLTSVLGTAEYNGDAVGVYVHETYKTTDGSVDAATSGHFTAAVSLTATFSQVPVSDTDTTGTIAPSQLNTLTGTISNFQLSGGEENNWEVVLSGDIDESNATASGTAKGGHPSDDGSFSATFHGPTGDDNDEKPHTVVGEFNAGFGNGVAAGAFGARN